MRRLLCSQHAAADIGPATASVHVPLKGRSFQLMSEESLDI